MSINLKAIDLLIVLFACIHIPYGCSKSIPQANDNSNEDNSNKTKVNSTDIIVTKLELDVTEATPPAPSLDHIVRKKRQETPEVPFDFDTLHLPCDLDHAGRAELVEYFPNSCKWVWNNKYVNEGFYRIYKTYQLEAFFFGQYYERLKRYEIDPHSFEYYNTKV